MDRSRERQGASKAILVSVQTPKHSEHLIVRSQNELAALLLDLGIAVEHRFIQKRSDGTSPSYLGSGKLKEIAAITGGNGIITRGPAETKIDHESEYLVVVDDELSPNQHRNLQMALGAEVLDRVSVILKIFEKRAQTKEAKLQVELAKLEHQLPRVKDDHSLGDKEGGGGRASRGHSNVELAKQRIRKQMADLRREISNCLAMPNSLSKTFQVALVGYTNAGKSSIMRGLTQGDVYIENKLFATLGTTTRSLHPPTHPEIFVTDTVGFIDRLPHLLIASFHSTLREASSAWLILHVVDASDSSWTEQIKVTNQVLIDLEIHHKPMWYVFNKADKLNEAQRDELRRAYPNALLTSALNQEDLRMLRMLLLEFRNPSLMELELILPYEKQNLFYEFKNQVEILSEEYGECIRLKVRSTKEILTRLKARLDA